VRLLFVLTLEPPPWLPSAVHLQLAALVERSMGDRAHFLDSVDKLRLPAAAAAVGVAVPPHALVGTTAEARAFAQERGYPVVLKRRHGFAGEGVAIVARADELAPAVEALLRPDPLDLGQWQAPRLLVQSFVTGPYHSQALVAWNGAPLASFAWERHVATQPVKGQTAVLRFVRSEQTRAAAERLGRAFGITGFFNVQFVIDAATGRAYLLEINRRLVTHVHVGERVGVDLAAALRARLAGAQVPAIPPLPGPTGPVVAVFPREWLRDPQSRHLVDHPVDVPWDDPELIEAMLAMRHSA
jgi:biotin carboxylase